MKIKEYIAKIVSNGKEEDMEELSEMLDETIIKLKSYSPECYKKYKMKLFGMAYDYKFDKELAEEMVHKMKPIGEKWSLETIMDLKDKYTTDYCDFYVVINSLANDYGEIINTEDIDTYIKMANAFIHDGDAIEHKVWKYFTTIPKDGE